MTSDCKPLVGILQCGEKPESMGDDVGDYDELFHTLLGTDAFRYRTWRALDGTLPDSIDEADAWLVTGSRFGAYEPHDWIPPLESFLRDIHAARVPLLGICFGHQVIAQALGGRVEKFGGGWAIGRTDYRFTADAGDTLPELAGLHGDAVPIMAWHQDQVTEPPLGAITVASSEICKHAALVYGDTTFTVQPHPEFDAAFVQGLLDTRGKSVPAPLRHAAAASLTQPLGRAAIADAMRRMVLARVAVRRARDTRGAPG